MPRWSLRFAIGISGIAAGTVGREEVAEERLPYRIENKEMPAGLKFRSAIADKLARAKEMALETDPGAALKDFIVGEVVTADKHPNADKLKLCMVDDGSVLAMPSRP